MMDQAFWDRQFKFSDVIPDFAAWLDQMANDSAALVSQRALSQRRYGDHPRQWVEWIEGDGDKNVLPVIIHGGYWRALEAETHRFMMPAFAAFGAHVANLEYRLVPEVSLGDVVVDVVAGLSLLCQLFPDEDLLLIGHSAGAHLALSALQDARLSGRIRGVMALSGVYDLAPVAHSFVQHDLQLTPEEVTSYTLTPSTNRPPVLYVNGTEETYEFIRGAALMADKGTSALHLLEGAHHMSLPHAACAQAETLMVKLLSLKDLP